MAAATGVLTGVPLERLVVGQNYRIFLRNEEKGSGTFVRLETGYSGIPGGMPFRYAVFNNWAFAPGVTEAGSPMGFGSFLNPQTAPERGFAAPHIFVGPQSGGRRRRRASRKSRKSRKTRKSRKSRN